MAARTPRRVFASPFVITLAACTSSSTPPPQQPVVVQQGEDHSDHNKPHTNPPPPTGHEEPTPTAPQTVVTNPPRPTTDPAQPAPPPTPVDQKPEEKKPVDYDQSWLVSKSGATCSAQPRANCPKPAPGKPIPPCNPPPAMKYTCPDGMGDKVAVTVVKHAKATTCVIQPEPMKCPQGAMCNPPPPRIVPCPTR